MLMDGGYLNNVPADVMRDLGAKYVVAVDVGSAENNNPAIYGDTLSGWWVLFNSYNPFSKNYGEIPTLQDIQSKLAYAGSVPLREQITKMEGCHYLTPPILGYKTMDFAKFKEIEQVGYEYGKKIIQEWNEKGVLAEQFGIKLVKSTSYARRASV
jgi:lysophospholipid hydrolase